MGLSKGFCETAKHNEIYRKIPSSITKRKDHENEEKTDTEILEGEKGD